MTTSASQREQELQYNFERLVEINLALSAEKDIFNLLEMILYQAQVLTLADAGTLYIPDDAFAHLQFAIMHNDTMQSRVRADESQEALPRVPLSLEGAPNHANVSSHVALTGETVNIPDVYADDRFDFSGPRQYDKSTGYRSTSMLVVPIKSAEDKVLGVLQLLNAIDPDTGAVKAFGTDQESLVASLTSVASVAMRNTQLIAQLSTALDRSKRLQEKEKTLNQELSDAYRKLESTHGDLAAAVKKMRTVRVIIGLFVGLCLLGGVGFTLWHRSFFSEAITGASTAPASVPAPPGAQFVIVPRPVTARISLTGTLAPLKEVTLVSPFAGRVAERFFEYGEYVHEGERLLRMDDSELVVKLREARSALIKAQLQYDDVLNWANGPEVARARRSLARSKATVESNRLKLEETRNLYEKGIIARSEYDTAREQVENVRYELKTAAEELASVLEKGGEKNVEVARLELDNAKARLRDLEDQLSRAEVFAPVSGVVIQPRAEGKTKAKVVAPGIEFGQSDALVTIGDMQGLSVVASADEIDVSKIMMRQPVTVSGDAFPELTLHGRVEHVSELASDGGYGKGPTFDVVVSITDITSEQMRRLKVGMTCNLEITVYSNPRSLMVPIGLVSTDGDAAWVFVSDPATGTPRRTPVKTGLTTLGEVEITEGLKEGDAVVDGSGGGAPSSP